LRPDWCLGHNHLLVNINGARLPPEAIALSTERQSHDPALRAAADAVEDPGCDLADVFDVMLAQLEDGLPH
jgi:hypothetical protein